VNNARYTICDFDVISSRDKISYLGIAKEVDDFTIDKSLNFSNFLRFLPAAPIDISNHPAKPTGIKTGISKTLIILNLSFCNMRSLRISL
jgi:hypothetical protein